MFRIGDFSRIARVSARLLRYYDEIGLLKPVSVDDATGYRYYSASQLSELNRILVFRDLGFALEEIAQLMAQNLPAEEIKTLLGKRRQEIHDEMQASSQQLKLIETRISLLNDEGSFTADDVLIRAEPARRLISLRRRVNSFMEAQEGIPDIVRQVKTILGRQPLGQMMAIAHAAEFEVDNIDVEFGFILPEQSTPKIPAGSDLQINELPASPRVVTAVRLGPPEQSHLVTRKIGAYVELNRLRLAGPSRELFLQAFDPAHPESSLVEMQFPVEDLASQ